MLDFYRRRSTSSVRCGVAMDHCGGGEGKSFICFWKALSGADRKTRPGSSQVFNQSSDDGFAAFDDRMLTGRSGGV
jgi:hypothetical protein